MAERHLWPAVLAGGWRSRPAMVRVAAGLLLLFGLLLVLVEAGEGPLEVVVAVTGLVLLAAAVALVWAGRLGYWLGLAVAALLALLVVAALTRNPGIGGVIVTALGGLPLILRFCRLLAGHNARLGRPQLRRPVISCPDGHDRSPGGDSSRSCSSPVGC
jgi:hypothetical protein